MEQEILEEIARERDPSEELIYSMIGSRRVQFIRMEVAGEGVAWEMAEGPEGWILSRSQVRATDARPVLTGYEPLICPSEALKGIYDKISSVMAPLFLPQTNAAGQGGHFYEFAIWGGLYQCIRLKWWNNTPAGGWEAFTNYVEECLSMFEGLKVDEKRLRWWEK